MQYTCIREIDTCEKRYYLRLFGNRVLRIFGANYSVETRLECISTNRFIGKDFSNVIDRKACRSANGERAKETKLKSKGKKRSFIYNINEKVGNLKIITNIYYIVRKIIQFTRKIYCEFLLRDL